MTAVAAALAALLVVAVPTAAIGATALGIGVVRERRERRRAALVPGVRAELLERLAAPTAEHEDGRARPAWDDWVATLDDEARSVLASLVEHYLQVLAGEDRQQLVALASSLGVDGRARRDLATGTLGDRRRALRWLVLLRTPVEPDLLLATCTDDPRTRAGAARLLWVTDHPEAATVGTALLCWTLDTGSSTDAPTGRGPSALDIDTLFRLNRADPGPLVRRVVAGGEAWPPAVLAAALDVVARCHGVDAWQLQWVRDALDHDESVVRAAAVGALDRHGWREGALSGVDLGGLLADPDPEVRHVTHCLVANWGSEEDLEPAVADAVDASARDRLSLARALVDAQRVPEPVPAHLAAGVRWARAARRAGGGPE